MGFLRRFVRDNGMAQGNSGSMPEFSQATDSAQTIPAYAMLPGVLYVRDGMTAGRTDTTATAEDILAQLPELNVGESYLFAISVTTAFALTLTGGTGVTVGDKTTVAASSMAWVKITKTSATTVSLRIL